jgi:hypothetical protein
VVGKLPVVDVEAVGLETAHVVEVVAQGVLLVQLAVHVVEQLVTSDHARPVEIVVEGVAEHARHPALSERGILGPTPLFRTGRDDTLVRGPVGVGQPQLGRRAGVVARRVDDLGRRGRWRRVDLVDTRPARPALVVLDEPRSVGVRKVVEQVDTQVDITATTTGTALGPLHTVPVGPTALCVAPLDVGGVSLDEAVVRVVALSGGPLDGRQVELLVLERVGQLVGQRQLVAQLGLVVTGDDHDTILRWRVEPPDVRATIVRLYRQRIPVLADEEHGLELRAIEADERRVPVAAATRLPLLVLRPIDHLDGDGLAELELSDLLDTGHRPHDDSLELGLGQSVVDGHRDGVVVRVPTLPPDAVGLGVV